MKRIYIYGASGHGLVVADVARACGYDKIIWIDDGMNSHQTFDEINIGDNIPIIIGVGDNQIRAKIFHKIAQLKMTIITLTHPSCVISPSVILGKGIVVMPNVVINAETKIGDGCIINSASVIEHENVLGDFVHISPHVALAGNVTISEFTHIGIGTSVKQGITVGKNSMVGAGSVVLKDIGNSLIAYGNPCVEKGELK